MYLDLVGVERELVEPERLTWVCSEHGLGSFYRWLGMGGDWGLCR